MQALSQCLQHRVAAADLALGFCRHGVQQGLHRHAIVAHQLAADQVVGLDAGGAFVDGGDAGITHVLRCAGLFDEAHAAVDLHAVGGDALGLFGAAALDDGDQQIDQSLALGTCGFVRMAVGAVHLCSGKVGQGTHGLGAGLHVHQHAAHIGVADDAAAAFGQGATLHTVDGVGAGTLVGALGNRHAFQTHVQAGVVHHREHVAQTLVGFSDQIPDGARSVAKRHHGRGARMNTHLVLDGRTHQIVALTQ